MIDRSLAGTRCHTVRSVSHHGGIIPRQLGGTIRYRLENLGRFLLKVDFDSGDSLTVLADDIVVDEDTATRA